MRRPQPKERVADYAPPGVFFVFAALGVVYIAIAKSLGLPAEQVTLVPCLLMLGYAGLILSIKRLRLRDDQNGDNFYYMGFIYTLTSLAMSLIQFGSGSSVDDIIRNFGVAVASTIMGIALRIFFNQMRRDPVDVEAYSRLDLAEASNRVRRELDGMLIELAHFRRTNQQMLAEGFQEIRDEVERSTRQSLAAMSSMAEEALKSVRQTNQAVSGEVRAADLRSELDQTTKNLKRISTALSKASDQVETASRAFTEKLSQFSPPDRVIEVKLQPTIDGLEAAIAKLGSLLEDQSTAMHKLGIHVEGQAANTGELQTAITSQLDRQAALIATLETRVAEGLDRLEKTAAAASSGTPPARNFPRSFGGFFRRSDATDMRAENESPDRTDGRD